MRFLLIALQDRHIVFTAENVCPIAPLPHCRDLLTALLASGAHFCISGFAAETRICSCWGAYEHSQHRTCAKTKMLAADLQQEIR